MSGAGEATQLLAVGRDDGPAHASPDAVSGFAGSQFAGISMAAHTAAQPAGVDIVTHDVHLRAVKQSAAGKVLAALLISLAGVTAFYWYESGNLSNIMAMLGLSEVEEPQLVAKPVKETIEPKVEPAVAPAQEPASGPKRNVWSMIANEAGADIPQAGPALSADQDAVFRERLAHEFTYQRYKAVVDLSELRASGSQDLLREALGSTKFWTRMRALIGLAELGEEVTADDVQLALGDARSELRANFFKRFETSPCGVGCYFVARAALPHLDARGREQVIRVIAKEKSAVRDLYLVAATFDESENVRKTAREWLDGHSVDQSVWSDVRSLGL